MLKMGIVSTMLFVVLLSLSGCDQSPTDAVKKINTIKLLDIQPPLSEILIPGQMVDMEVKVAYKLESKAATITLAVLQTEGQGNKSLTSTFTIIQKGEGEQILKGQFVVPKTKIIQVRIPLSPQQRSDTAPFITHTYKVISVGPK